MIMFFCCINFIFCIHKSICIIWPQLAKPNINIIIFKFNMQLPKNSRKCSTEKSFT
uniref:Candidate secreted effector n=1 Tax=Meloidogyne incognita TaxID=6306 RepID=A0A914L0A6_MELIC